MNNYKLEVKHDYGTITLTLNTASEEKAIETVMRMERCPRNSIVSVQQLEAVSKAKHKWITFVVNPLSV